MNAEIKEKWIAALVSGKYSQVKGKLRRDNGYCCLGVLCDIKEDGKWKLDITDSAYIYKEEQNFLPLEIQEWAELFSDDPHFYVPKDEPLYKEIEMLKAYIRIVEGQALYCKLSQLNDNLLTFEEIAHLIDKYL